MLTFFFTLVICPVVVFVIGFCISKLVYYDDDPDMFWYETDNSPSHGGVGEASCPHNNKSLVVVNTAATCETVHTVCDDCGKTLKSETEC